MKKYLKTLFMVVGLCFSSFVLVVLLYPTISEGNSDYVDLFIKNKDIKEEKLDNDYFNKLKNNTYVLYKNTNYYTTHTDNSYLTDLFEQATFSEKLDNFNRLTKEDYDKYLINDTNKYNKEVGGFDYSYIFISLEKIWDLNEQIIENKDGDYGDTLKEIQYLSLNITNQLDLISDSKKANKYEVINILIGIVVSVLLFIILFIILFIVLLVFMLILTFIFFSIKKINKSFVKKERKPFDKNK